MAKKNKQYGTQPERILKHLQEVGPIDPLQAWKLHGVYRLGGIIYFLKKPEYGGHNIATKRIKVENQYGETVCVAEYSLAQ